MSYFTYLPKSEAPGGSLIQNEYTRGCTPGGPWILGTHLAQKGERRRRTAIYQARYATGVNPDIASAYNIPVEHQRSTNTVPAVEAWNPQDPTLVPGFELGSLQYGVMPGSLILPEIDVAARTSTTPSGSLEIEVPQWGTEHYELHNTDRGMGAAYNEITGGVTTTTWKLDFYGLVGATDTRVVNHAASFLNIAGRHMAWVRRAMFLDRERAVRNLILDTSNYTASHAVALTTEWDHASGDSKADWDSLFVTMSSASPVPRELMTITLTSYDSLNAAYNDPTFKAQRTSTLGVSPSAPTLSELARYWRVLRVNVADVLVKTSPTASATSLWGDAAVAHWAGDTAPVNLGSISLDDLFGAPLLGGLFTGNPGIAQAPYTTPNPSKSYWPMDMVYLPKITNYSVLGLLTNVQA